MNLLCFPVVELLVVVRQFPLTNPRGWLPQLGLGPFRASCRRAAPAVGQARDNRLDRCIPEPAVAVATVRGFHSRLFQNARTSAFLAQAIAHQPFERARSRK